MHILSPIPSVCYRAGLGKATNFQTAIDNGGNIVFVEAYLELSAFHHLELVSEVSTSHNLITEVSAVVSPALGASLEIFHLHKQMILCSNLPFTVQDTILFAPICS